MADTKLSALTEISVPDFNDDLYLVNDTGPTSGKIGVDRVLGLGYTAPGAKLSILSGATFYNPLNKALVPSATSTGSDTVDFAAAHGWLTGSVVVVDATVGGLSVQTPYYINVVDSDTISFHLTHAAALAGTSKVDLTATITQTILLLGLASNVLYLALHEPCPALVRVYDGTRWLLKTLAATSLTLSGLTANRNYDVFLDDDATTLSLSAAWNADNITRTDALGLQDGVTVLGSDHTKLWFGTVRAIETAAIESSTSKRFVWNIYHQEELSLFVQEWTTSWAISNSITWRQTRATTFNRVEVVVGDGRSLCVLAANMLETSDADGAAFYVGIGLDSTTLLAERCLTAYVSRPSVLTTGPVLAVHATFADRLTLGYHALNWLEATSGPTATHTHYGSLVSARRTGLAGWVKG